MILVYNFHDQVLLQDQLLYKPVDNAYNNPRNKQTNKKSLPYKRVDVLGF